VSGEDGERRIATAATLIDYARRQFRRRVLRQKPGRGIVVDEPPDAT
jgi:hypothetical protein